MRAFYLSIIMACILVVSSLPSSAFAVHSFQVTMTLTNTDATVYIPGQGEVAAGSMNSATYTTLPHYYVCSYENDALTGLVYYLKTPYSVSVSSSTSTYSMTTNQSFERSMVFAVFSKGSYKKIENMIGIVEAKTFLDKPKPSFGFGLGKGYDIRMYLAYDLVDLVGQRGVFNKGERRVVVSNNGTVSNKATITMRGL
ncbi:MAG: hypothetical protein GXO64_04710 [Candidatus Micrarchaeota archaeon]|nr:hypothetical protein [Candidatus Micrarchaeota archaeon]